MLLFTLIYVAIGFAVCVAVELRVQREGDPSIGVWAFATGTIAWPLVVVGLCLWWATADDDYQAFLAHPHKPCCDGCGNRQTPLRWHTSGRMLCGKCRDEIDGLEEERTSIVCPHCGRRSYNPGDVTQGYCGACHTFTRNP